MWSSPPGKDELCPEETQKPPHGESFFFVVGMNVDIALLFV